MNKILIYFFPIIILTACNSSKKSTSNTTEVSEETYPIEQDYQFENLNLKDSVFASIEKGYCFGQCPVYSMKIYNNGLIKYSGRKNVKLIGSYVMEINREQMLPFIDTANSIKYMEMEDVYDNTNITDLPSTTTSIVIDRKRKTIKRRFNYPKEIIRFENLFDALLKSDNWVKVISKDDKKR